MNILHLYPNLMNLYGDYGNITVLIDHLKDLGIEVNLDKKEVTDLIDFNKYDFIYMGSGTEENEMIALQELKKYKVFLNNYCKQGKAGLFTGNAMELFGNKINEEEALGFVDFNVSITDKRYTGDVILKNDYLGEVVGFINRSSIIDGGRDNSLFTYEFRYNNLPDNDYEGFRYHNIFGTHVIGPVLVKNPKFMKYILQLLAKDKYQDLNYSFEEEAYSITLNELRKR